MVASSTYAKLYIVKSSHFKKILEEYAQDVNEFLNSQGYGLKKDHKYSGYKYVSTDIPVDIGIKAFLMLNKYFTFTPYNFRLNYRKSKNIFEFIKNPHPFIHNFIHKKVISAYRKGLVPDTIILSFAESKYRYNPMKRRLVDLMFFPDYFPYF